jgi:glyoxylase-like metal-dependent hydrolase (beta-lactamase superfamily II)
VRAVAPHPDVIVVTSALLHANCVIVRGGGERAETFVIDSPVLPEELDALPAVIEQAGFPVPSGLLATHADWDHMLGRLAYPTLALGCAASTTARLRSSPGEAQRELRAFDEELLIERERPLTLGSPQELPVPGRCEIGEHTLELHPTGGHTVDGMAVLAAWTDVLAVGDYLSTLELPSLADGGSLEAYLATLERLATLVSRVEYVVPGHGPLLDRERAQELLAEDRRYLLSLRSSRRGRAGLPRGRSGAAARRTHATNLARVSG